MEELFKGKEAIDRLQHSVCRYFSRFLFVISPPAKGGTLPYGDLRLPWRGVSVVGRERAEEKGGLPYPDAA